MQPYRQSFASFEMDCFISQQEGSKDDVLGKTLLLKLKVKKSPPPSQQFLLLISVLPPFQLTSLERLGMGGGGVKVV